MDIDNTITLNNVGLIQMTSGADPWLNLNYIEQQIALCVAQGANWILTPENALVFGLRSDYHRFAEPLGRGPLQDRVAYLAQHYRVWIIIGSMPIQTPHGVTATTLIYDDAGQQVSHYDKLHMFDVDVADSHHQYRESDTFLAGQQVRTCETPFGHLGLSICYDVRFPHLYTELRHQGAQVIIVPSCFTAVTGEAHWEVLLRSRAIETQCWIVAVGQGGRHGIEGQDCYRETWGHSMVIDPWGRVVQQLGQQAESAVVEIDLLASASIRQAMPVSEHSRFKGKFIVLSPA
ncbi:amidohydrolase [Vibrio sp. 10N.286.49.B3]|uniref:carbon-nitrogen hydrolase family protein n=1 Tax=Vibrio sp. 10N.286.49.B3 TaxID=1880855 RepID=UPI000C86579C|nr:carbon-nitrogen hydrolase family protein [Vibrio sp. 10N.286.49.B3]PMH39877.1 amidohydrolase [Vibrio sp. 10N.286.49.B3]